MTTTRLKNLLLTGLAVAQLVLMTPMPAPGHSVVEAIKDWTKVDVADRPDFLSLPIVDSALSKPESAKVKQLLWDDHVAQLREQREQEWKDKSIKLGDLKMKFDYRVFGEKPESGRRLFISMHGGGGSRASVNDRQWQNQIGLYKPKEGVYLAPRAPNDAWDMWHQEHIDKFFHRIIEDAILFEDVDVNRVYVMGYSAGGDGVYKLAPRMADSLAAAAMMAGHPNGASPANLRNIGFALHMGEKDGAYKRNKIAERWKTDLAKLQQADSAGYQHQAQIHEGLGHWMDRKDAVAVPWMSKFERDPNPSKVVWKQTGVQRKDFYWLAVTDGHDVTSKHNLVVARKDQKFTIESSDGLTAMKLNLNDAIVNLDEPISVYRDGKEIYQDKAIRTSRSIYQSIQNHGDSERIYSAQAIVDFEEAEPKEG